MKSVSDVLLLTASDQSCGACPRPDGSGQLQLQVEKDHLVSITTTYPKLDVPEHPSHSASLDDAEGGEVGGGAGREGGGGDGAQGGVSSASARLEIKRLLKVLAGLSQVHTSISTCLISSVPEACRLP